MPYKPKRPCGHPGCIELTEGKYCEPHAKAHAKQVEERRETSTQRGYGFRWQNARLTYLRHNPLCVQCLRGGDIVPATVVDHIVGHKGDQKLFWEKNNWQSLCKQHHDKKTAATDGAFGRIG